MSAHAWSRYHSVAVLATAVLALSAGCSKPNVELQRQSLIPAEINLALIDVDPALPPITGKENPLARAGTPDEPLEVRPGRKIMLVRCIAEEIPAALEEEWHRAHVIVLDGLATGAFEVTPENGRMIETTPYRPARQPYVGLEGSIRILSISKTAVTAYCGVHNIIHGDEKVYPLRGLYTFRFGSGEEPALAKCAIHVTASAGKPAPAAGAPGPARQSGGHP